MLSGRVPTASFSACWVLGVLAVAGLCSSWHSGRAWALCWAGSQWGTGEGAHRLCLAPEPQGACGGLGEVLGLHPLHSLRMPGSVALAEPLPAWPSPREGPASCCSDPSRGSSGQRRACFKITTGNLKKVSASHVGSGQEHWEPAAIPSPSLLFPL